MPNVLVNEQYLSNIASAIRMQNGLTSSYTISQMAAAISNIILNGSLTADIIAYKNYGSEISGNATEIGSYMCYKNSELTSVSFPNCISIYQQAFWSCTLLTTISFPNCTFIGQNAFTNCPFTIASFPSCEFVDYGAFVSCSNLSEAYFPNCSIISGYAFYSCTDLTKIDITNCTDIRYSAFNRCISLTSINCPNCLTISSYAFMSCWSLTEATFPKCSNFGNQAFQYCSKFISLYLNNVSSVPVIQSSTFQATPIGGYSTIAGQYGNVFVPKSLYTSFITATNWATISSRIVSV